MRIHNFLDEDGRQRAEEAMRYFDLGIAMQPQVCACMICLCVAASDEGHTTYVRKLHRRTTLARFATATLA